MQGALCFFSPAKCLGISLWLPAEKIRGQIGPQILQKQLSDQKWISPPRFRAGSHTAFPCTHRWKRTWTSLPRPGEKLSTTTLGVLQGRLELGIREPNPAKTKPLRKPRAVSHSSPFITYKHRAVLEAVWLAQLNQLLKSWPVPSAAAGSSFQPALLPSLDTPLQRGRWAPALLQPHTPQLPLSEGQRT